MKGFVISSKAHKKKLKDLIKSKAFQFGVRDRCRRYLTRNVMLTVKLNLCLMNILFVKT